MLRLQPGDALVLFNGSDGADWPAEIVRIGRREVEVRLGAPRPVERELACAVTIALGVPANDRMDALVEKASELGAAAIQPLVCERSVVRLAGERAEAKRAHWQAVATAASEQCGRARVAACRPVASLAAWLESLAARDRAPRRAQPGAAALDPARRRREPSPRRAARADACATPSRAVVVLSGPEGGLAPAEEAAALRARLRCRSASARASCAPTPRRSRCSPGSACARSHRKRRDEPSACFC